MNWGTVFLYDRLYAQSPQLSVLPLIWFIFLKNNSVVRYLNEIQALCKSETGFAPARFIYISQNCLQFKY